MFCDIAFLRVAMAAAIDIVNPRHFVPCAAACLHGTINASFNQVGRSLLTRGLTIVRSYDVIRSKNLQ